MTRDEFIQKVRTKYPQWNKIDDDTLYNQVLERYPSYRGQITEVAEQPEVMAEPEQEKPGFFSRAGTALKERFGELKKTFGEVKEGEISKFEAGARYVGDIAGGVGDIVGAAVSPAVEKLAEKEWAQPAFQALSQGMESYEEWKNSSEINRRTAEVMESVANIVDLVAGAKGLSLGGKAIKKGATEAVETAGRIATKVDDVVIPSLRTAKEAAVEVIPNRQAIVSGQITKALDLTAGDVSNLKLATKNDIGEWVVNNNLIGGNKKETLSNINNFVKNQYDLVREEISKVPTIYTSKTAPRVRDSLLLLKNELTGVFGQEGALKEIDNLLKQKNYTLSDVQRVKELLDDQFDLYKATGDVKAGQTKVGLANVRKEIKEFIENEVKNNTGADIRALNNDVATGRNITKLAEKRGTRGWTRANVSLADLGWFGTGSILGTPLTGAAALFAKRVLESSTVRLKIADFLKKLPTERLNKIKNTLSKGEVPKEFQSLNLNAKSIKNSSKAASPIEDSLTKDIIPDTAKKSSFNSPAVGKTASKIEPLIQEAKKYKSAEEFVRDAIDGYLQGSSGPMEVQWGSAVPFKGEIPYTGLPTTVDPSIAKRFSNYHGGMGGTINKAWVKPNAKIIKFEELPNSFRSEEGMDAIEQASRWAKRNGYDGIDMRGTAKNPNPEAEIRIFNKDVLEFDKNKLQSQLTDIWNKANR